MREAILYRTERLLRGVLARIDRSRGKQTLFPKSGGSRTALLAYLHPLYLGIKHPAYHTNVQEFNEMTRLLLENDYRVDVVQSGRNEGIAFKKHYDLIVDGFNVGNITAQGVKADRFVIYATTAHPSYNNRVIANRCREVFETFGIEFRPSIRWIPEPHQWDGVTDFAYCGGEAQVATYGSVIDRMPRIPITLSTIPTARKPSPSVDLHRPTFVHFGGDGFLMRGADIITRLFLRRKDWDLHLIGPSPFELGVSGLFPGLNENKTENIKVHGMRHMNDPEVLSIIDKSVALVYPSFSEGRATAVLNTLVRGAIAVVSEESGLEESDFVRVLAKDEHTIEAWLESLIQNGRAELNLMKEESARVFSRRFNLERFSESFSDGVCRGRQ